jgi:iron complex outermembrane receptor protein
MASRVFPRHNWIPPAAQICGLALGTFVAAVPAQAAEATADEEPLQEVIVTANKREENLQRVAITAIVLSGDQIRDRVIRDAVDLSVNTPALSANATAGRSGKASFSLRGVGLLNFAETNEAAVAIYKDELYIAPLSAGIVSLLDLQRVEVLKGPQGTLFGRAAPGGLVHFVANRPELGSNAGYVDASVGSYDAITIEAAQNFALGERAALRLSAKRLENSGWIENRIGPDTNRDLQTSVRAQLRFQPNERINNTLKLEHAEVGTSATNGFVHMTIGRNAAGEFIEVQAPDGLGFFNDTSDYWSGALDDPGLLDLRSRLAQNTLTVDLGADLQLTSITGFLDVEKEYFEDLDVGPTFFRRAFVGLDTRQLVQELRLSNAARNSDVRWTAGAFYFDWDTTTQLFIARGPQSDFSGSYTEQGRQSAAVFGQVEWDFAQRFTLTAGARVERESVDFFTQLVPASPLPAGRMATDVRQALTPITLTDLTGEKRSYVSGGLGLSYRATDRLLAFATYRRGTKPAGFNAPLSALPPRFFAYDQEKLDAYEIGVKAENASGNLVANATAWYYDYADYQASQRLTLEVGSVLSNADAQLAGVDASLLWSPSPLWQLGTEGTLIARRSADLVLDPRVGPVTLEVPYAPRLSITSHIERAVPLARGEISMRLEHVYKSQVKYIIDQPFPVFTGGQQQLINARVDWTLDQLSIGAFVENATNDEYALYKAGNTGVGFGRYVPGRPRWWGLQVRYDW